MELKINQNENVHGGLQKDFYQANEVKECPCPLCGSNEFNFLCKERGHIGVVKCKSCDLIYANPRVIGSELNYHGDANLYYNEARLIFKGTRKHHRDANYEFELKEIKKHKSHGKFLDIGTNMGFFLRKARRFGFDVSGVEPSPSLSKIATEQFFLKIHTSFFENIDFAPKSQDVITMIDVFEHVNNPKELLIKANKVLKDDGIICVKVPNGNYNWLKYKLAKLTGKNFNYDIFNAYEHVAHYTPETMAKMLNEGGFRIKKLILPIPIHPPVWANLVGHYYQYPSPFILDWKRILIRKSFYYIGKLQKFFGMKITFAPDLMFIIEKS
jgi:2-polyprenyl-3-methyl-5-hydroxy-6-metoxy-1,4-benzoquinol methylase